MDEYKQYLAQKLLTEDQLVTYRLLSRALKVHVNTAKEMLYEFHKWQNGKRPNSLHATYLIYGTRKQVDQQDGQQDDDVEMTNSQNTDELQVPLSDEVPIQTLSLIREEQLLEALAQYDEVTSIHVYSLAPHPLKDLQLLADTARQVLELSSGDSSPASDKVYGAISNPNMRKRERRGPAPKSITNAPTPKVEPMAQLKQEAKPSSLAPGKEEPKPSTTSAPIKKPTPSSSLKRQSSSGIGQMFAKAAAKPKKPAAAKAPEEEKAAMSDDGEDDAEPMADVKQEDSSNRQLRKNRQAELEAMMDEEEEEEEEPEKAESPAEEPMEEDEPSPSEPEPKAEEPAELVSSAGDGRRRGRRRVMRKKQILDEQGYLVTIQEPGWESFSEDEAPAPAPSKPKPKAQPVKAEPTAKPKKAAAAKGAQGNIMSFFSKK
ncbi:DNA polymerase subunit Cdc27 [Biscogniauxia marginata]|nr:DNA polymerase subunit Cdc27 [Biscogniauxia marginata]